MEYITECQSRLSKTNYHINRGISAETAARFGLGYDPNCKYGFPALIIPTGGESYTVRATIEDAKKRYMNVGTSELLNVSALWEAEKPVYIVEGEIDALSIVEAGGEAVSLGSAANWRKLVTKLKEREPAQPLILALDNDEAGKSATEELSEALEGMEIFFIEYNPYGECKDANEALCVSKAALAVQISRGEKKAFETEEADFPPTERGLKDARLNAMKNAKPHIPTGFERLDNALDGGLSDELYIIGAGSSMGKTAFALQLTYNAAMAKHDALFVSLEMSGQSLWARQISRLSFHAADLFPDAVTAGDILTGGKYRPYTEKQKENIRAGLDAYDLASDHIRVIEGSGDFTVEALRSTLKKLTRFRRPAPVVFIDYVQILPTDKNTPTDKRRLDIVVSELKRISRDFKTPVVALSSINRASYEGSMGMSSFKESGGVEYAGDVLLGLQFRGANEKSFDEKAAKGKTPREIELIILKNRNGVSGASIPLCYNAAYNYFAEE